MTEAKLKATIEAIVAKDWPYPVNRHDRRDKIRLLVEMGQMMTVEQFADIRRGLYDRDEDLAAYPIQTRLERLHHRLEADGQYTDANVVALAIEALAAKPA